MKEKIRVGIIGTGFARTVQIPAFQKCEGAEVVSVSSAHLENAERTAREFNIAHYTDDWRETVRNEAVDLICITAPPVFHREMTLFALENEKHVLCEKPMAMNAAQALEMLEKSREKNVLALVDHELRFLNGRQAARAMILNGAIGQIRHAKYNFRAPHRGSEDSPWNWWSDVESGGGARRNRLARFRQLALVCRRGDFKRFLPTANARQKKIRRKIRRDASGYN